MSHDNKNDDGPIFKVDTVPPPPGEGDAYNAPTRVGPISSAAVQEMMLAAEKESSAAEKQKASATTAPPPPLPPAKVEPPPRIYEDDEDAAATLLSPLAKQPPAAADASPLDFMSSVGAPQGTIPSLEPPRVGVGGGKITPPMFVAIVAAVLFGLAALVYLIAR